MEDDSEVREEIKDVISFIEENIETMTAVEIGKAVKKVETLVEELGEDIPVSSIDAESHADGYRGYTRDRLESINRVVNDTEGFIDLFKSAKTKLDDTINDIKTKSNTNNKKRIVDLSSLLISKKDKVKDNISSVDLSKKLGKRLTTVTTAKLTLDDLLVFANDIEKLNTNGDSMNSTDKGIMSLAKKYRKTIKDKDYIKATRIDGDNMSYIVAGVEKDVVGFRGYADENINKNISKDIISIKIKDTDINVDYAKKLLDTADKINILIPNKADIFIKDLSELNNILLSDKKSLDYISKISIVAGNTVYYVGMTGFLLGSAYLSIAGIGIGLGYTLAMKGLKDRVALLIANVVSAGVFASTIPTISSTMDYIRKIIKTDEANDYTAINQILNMRAKLTIRYANDALFGLNKLVDDLITTASIIIDSLEDKEK